MCRYPQKFENDVFYLNQKVLGLGLEFVPICTCHVPISPLGC